MNRDSIRPNTKARASLLPPPKYFSRPSSKVQPTRISTVHCTTTPPATPIKSRTADPPCTGALTRSFSSSDFLGNVIMGSPLMSERPLSPPRPGRFRAGAKRTSTVVRSQMVFSLDPKMLSSSSPSHVTTGTSSVRRTVASSLSTWSLSSCSSSLTKEQNKVKITPLEFKELEKRTRLSELPTVAPLNIAKKERLVLPLTPPNTIAKADAKSVLSRLGDFQTSPIDHRTSMSEGRIKYESAPLLSFQAVKNTTCSLEQTPLPVGVELTNTTARRCGSITELGEDIFLSRENNRHSNVRSMHVGPSKKSPDSAHAPRSLTTKTMPASHSSATNFTKLWCSGEKLNSSSTDGKCEDPKIRSSVTRSDKNVISAVTPEALKSFASVATYSNSIHELPNKIAPPVVEKIGDDDCSEVSVSCAAATSLSDNLALSSRSVSVSLTYKSGLMCTFPLPASSTNFASLPHDASTSESRFRSMSLLLASYSTSHSMFQRDLSNPRWSLTVPLQGMPSDMLAILGELEALGRTVEVGGGRVGIRGPASGGDASVEANVTEHRVANTELVVACEPLSEVRTLWGTRDKGKGRADGQSLQNVATANEFFHFDDFPSHSFSSLNSIVSSSMTMDIGPIDNCHIYDPAHAPEFLQGASGSLIVEPAVGWSSPSSSRWRSTQSLPPLRPPARASGTGKTWLGRMRPNIYTHDRSIAPHPSTRPPLTRRFSSRLTRFLTGNKKSSAGERGRCRRDSAESHSDASVVGRKRWSASSLRSLLSRRRRSDGGAVEFIFDRRSGGIEGGPRLRGAKMVRSRLPVPLRRLFGGARQ